MGCDGIGIPYIELDVLESQGGNYPERRLMMLISETIGTDRGDGKLHPLGASETPRAVLATAAGHWND